MSAERARRRDPGTMKLPVDRERFDAVMAQLPEAWRVRYLTELHDSLWRTQQSGDWRPVSDVVEAWFTSMEFALDPNRERDEARAAQALASGEAISAEDLIDELHRRWADADAAAG